MSALPGGSAEKIGNEYESWWTALRVADVLDGTASSIRLEPPGAQGFGAEFTITEGDVMWAEQVKDAAAKGSWTINRLIGDGILSAARAHVEDGRRFRFVASTPSALTGLCARAQGSESIRELIEALNKGQAEDLRQVAEHWDVTKEQAREFLRRTEVVHHSNDSMRQLVHTRFQLLLADDPEVVVATLGAFCTKNLQQTLTAPAIWAHLEAKGFKRRHLVGDQKTVALLHRTVERQHSRVNGVLPEVGLVPRADVAALVERLEDPVGEQVVVLDAPAGYGKSTVVAQIAAELERSGWFVAIVRMDGLEVATNTSDKLGKSIGLSETPVVLLAGVASGEPALLIVDQLDAVSSYSGRIPDNFEAVAEMLRELPGFKNVKALLVVRSVDLEADSRLRQLVRRSDNADRHTLGPLPIGDVKTTLTNAGVKVPTSDATLELLRIPLHLSVFSRLSADGQTHGYRTLPELYDRFTTELRSRVTERVGPIDWQLITGAMVTHMSDNEMLVAPAALLDAAKPTHVQALVSESVLAADGATYAFFHESYFDYLFARSFVAAGRDLHNFLAGSGQVLFRRAQTRQVLEHLAATDRDAFRATVVRLLDSDQIRFHLKAVVVELLGHYDATTEDWQALDPIAFDDSSIANRIRALLRGPAWFDAADDLGLWAAWLDDPNRVDLVFRELMLAARERSKRVSELLRPHIGENEDWRLRIRSLVEWSITPGLTDLVIELLEGGHLDDASGRVAVNSDFWSIVHHLFSSSPTDAIRVAAAYLHRALALAEARGSQDPFESGILNAHSQGGGVLDDMRQADPAMFVRELLGFVITVAMANQHERERLLPSGRRWAYRHIDTDFTIDDDIFNALDAALRDLAKGGPALVEPALGQLRDAESAELRFLACRTLTVSGPADGAIEWLVGDPRNLVLGWSDSPRWASRELIEAWSPTCSEALFDALEAAVLGYRNPWETRQSVGYGQYELLSAFDETRLSDHARRKLGELSRRFNTRTPSPPSPVEASFVGSPISDEASKRMSDADWLRALAKHDQEGTFWDREPPVGGARELAQVLGRRTVEDPERFARLGLQLGEQIPPAALNEIIRNLPGTIDPDILADVCEHSRALHGEAIGQDICWTIAKLETLSQRVVNLVVACSTDTDPETEGAWEREPSEDRNLASDLFHAGLNSTRGEAALAVAHILFCTDEFTDTLRPVVEGLVNDPSLAVRTCAAEAVRAMLNREPALGLNLGEQLFDAPIDLLDAHTTERLLIYLVRRSPDRFTPIIATGLQANDHIATRAGVVWAVAVVNDVPTPGLPTELADLPPAARRGAAKVFAVNVADTQAQLIELFDDDDSEVRRHAARSMRHLDALDIPRVEAMVRGFLTSQSFPEHFEDLLDALNTMTATLPEVAIEVCEQAVETAGSDMGDIRTARAMAGPQVTNIVLRLYRQAEPALRRRCLDLIDRLTEVAAYGVEEALAEDR